MHLQLLAAALTTVAQAISLWDPTGPYHVGYTQHIFNHTTPDDFTKPGTFMLLTIYYPTLQVPNTTVPYLDPISTSFLESTIGLPKGILSQLTTRLQFQAPTLLGTKPCFANGTSPYPTIVFTPGAGPASATYTAYLSELASHGYVVVAIDHPGEPAYLPLPYTNGTGGVYGYPDFSAFPPEPLLETAFKVLDYRVSDVLTAMSDDFFPALVRQHGAPFNLTHFGIFGHSIGGAAAAAVMASKSPGVERFKVGSNLDGTFFQVVGSDGNVNTSLPAPDLKLPFLELGGENHFEGNASADDSFTYFNDAQTGWLRNIQVNGTRHLDFSDIPLWIDLLDQRAVLDNAPWVGPADGINVTKTVNALLAKFFGSMMGEGLEGVDALVEKDPELLLLTANDPSRRK